MLVREIILFDDRIEIYYKHTDRQKPDEIKTHQAFCVNNKNSTQTSAIFC